MVQCAGFSLVPNPLIARAAAQQAASRPFSAPARRRCWVEESSASGTATSAQTSVPPAPPEPPGSRESGELSEPEIAEEECDDMAEEELQQQVEELRKKQELEEKLSKLRRQQEELERERREVQDLLRGFAQGAGGHHPRRARGARRVSQPRQASALDLRIDGKSLSSATPSQRSAASTRPSTAAPSFSARPAAPVQRSASCSSSHFREAERGMEKKSTKHTSLRDLHYERMRQQAEERLAILRQREVQREPWTAPDAGRHLPRRPWSAIPGYTGFRPRQEEGCIVGCNLPRAGLEARRLLSAKG